MCKETEESAYLAGIVDGEGCISISLPNFQLTLQIGSSTKRLIDYIISIEPRFVLFDYKHYKAKTRRSPNFWNCWSSGKKAKEIIQRVRPWLRLKDIQADIALQFPIQQGSRDEAKKLRQAIAYVQMKDLNKKGGEGNVE
jgi:hypothetical protein